MDKLLKEDIMIIVKLLIILQIIRIKPIPLTNLVKPIPLTNQVKPIPLTNQVIPMPLTNQFINTIPLTNQITLTNQIITILQKKLKVKKIHITHMEMSNILHLQQEVELSE